jgi:YD repeat-containing protein
MSIQYLQNSRLDVIGSIETTGQGMRIAYNKYRERVGEFNPRTNRTYDALRRLIGTGDHLAMLIAKSNH